MSSNYPDPYNNSTPYTTAGNWTVEDKLSRLVFVTRYVDLNRGDELAYYMGSTVSGSTCSGSSSHMLRSYVGVSGALSDVVYAPENVACSQFKVVKPASTGGRPALGYSFDVYCEKCFTLCDF
jgi:hypothetical protein